MREFLLLYILSFINIHTHIDAKKRDMTINKARVSVQGDPFHRQEWLRLTHSGWVGVGGVPDLWLVSQGHKEGVQAVFETIT
ncbi:hypothetical protein BDV24DRAFT_93065 [Aspergillus arachidicola]|uniref:Uncharacterized protein n=1 Tax=Aspergillus arachidicola TaxID=656916 RepID=A0A5N6XY94_9EURO|nr:hypothetical protein BDV24DRAFT_93065 [Aspergillus arachidicola]